jgi:hypothetical protein
MVFTLSGWMLYAMWIVLGLMALDFLASLYQSLKTGNFSYKMILSKLQDMLYYVFPLFLLANIMSLDSTGWSLVLIGYYIGAVGVALKYVFDIKSKL